MGNSRDDFTSATKELLANRVGRRCSNPACRKLTCGANTNPEKITNIGVAAHICAAAQGGPRYDASMTPEERKSFENGIWLCQSCSKLIDTDITRYPKELLQSWKQLAEQTAILEVETTSSTPAFEKDKELVQFYLECFDRPAFQDDIYQEGRMEDFDKAIEDTLIALNTGVLRTRDGSILKQADGKSSVQNTRTRPAPARCRPLSSRRPRSRFQQCTVVNNSNIVSQQRNLRKNVTGNQNSFPLASQSSRIKERTSAIPMGSRPLIGSSKIKSSGSCITARAMASRCFIPREYCEKSFLSL